MDENWTEDEVAVVIRARKMLKAKGFPKDVDVKAICEAAGISRKTGYQWANKLESMDQSQQRSLQQELAQLKAQHEQLKRRYEDLEFDNEGRKLAWEIHGVDELLRDKKNSIKARRKRRR
jgi:transposase